MRRTNQQILADWARAARQRSRTPNLAYFTARQIAARGPRPFEQTLLLAESPNARESRRANKRIMRVFRRYAALQRDVTVMLSKAIQLDVKVVRLADGVTEYSFFMINR